MAGVSLECDGLDLDDRKFLAVALLALVAFPLLLLEYDHFIPALVLEDLGRNGGSRERRLADLEICALAGGQHIIDLDRGSGLGVRKAVHDEDIALGYGELLSLCLDSGFHEIKPLTKPF